MTDKNKRPKSEFQRCVGHIYRVASSHIGLILLLVAYSFLGAAIFQALEGGQEKPFSNRTNITAARENFLKLLWNESFAAVDLQNWTQRVRSSLNEYETVYEEALINGDLEEKGDPWDFWGSLFYVGTVYTTIGYGHISPVTTAGRVVTMIYATIGIPLCLILLADLGKLFTRAIKFLWSFIRRWYYTGKCTKKSRSSPPPNEKGEMASNDEVDFIYAVDDEFNLPVPVAILITIAYIFVGAGMYRGWESTWTYLDAFYFIFISISTIGFGDIVPEHPRYFIITCIYIFIGLALVSMCINVIITFFTNTLDKAGQRVTHGLQRTMKIPLEDCENEQIRFDQ